MKPSPKVPSPELSQSDVGRPGRPYPDAPERARIFEIIAGIPPDHRTSQDWYALGALLAHEGFLEKKREKVEAGIEALKRAETFERPTKEARLELDWVTSLRARTFSDPA